MPAAFFAWEKTDVCPGDAYETIPASLQNQSGCQWDGGGRGE